MFNNNSIFTMDIIDSIEDIQNNLLEWFSENGLHWIPWKLKKDGSFPQSGAVFLLMGYGLLK